MKEHQGTDEMWLNIKIGKSDGKGYMKQKSKFNSTKQCGLDSSNP